jgi:tRNA(Ile)-lysidine synthase
MSEGGLSDQVGLSAMDLLARVRRTLRQHDLAGAGTRVVVALSGGPDSVALAHLVRELAAAGDVQVAGLAHFNHSLRPGAADDARFCEQLAESFSWPIAVETGDVPARAHKEHRSIEDAARASRYEFFARALTTLGGSRIALGHTRDDQAETFLLRLLRGAGVRGLASMHPRRGPFIRPLIDCRRADLRAYLDERGLQFLIDESNADVRIPRNRVRAELLPLLEARFNPSIVDTLAAQADVAREEWRWMREQAGNIWSQAVERTATGARIDAAALNAAPLALARLVMHRAMSEVGNRTIGPRHVDAALGVGRGDVPSIDAPGQRVDRNGGFVVLTGRPEGAVGRMAPRVVTNLFQYPLSIPGEVQLAESGCVLSAEPAHAASGSRVATRTSAVVRQDLLGRALSVRNRRPGDRFRPAGVAGRKKLQDYFVDAKVPRDARDTVPIVVDDCDRIVWVAGHAIDDEFRVTDPAQGVLLLRLRQL